MNVESTTYRPNFDPLARKNKYFEGQVVESKWLMWYYMPKISQIWGWARGNLSRRWSIILRRVAVKVSWWARFDGPLDRWGSRFFDICAWEICPIKFSRNLLAAVFLWLGDVMWAIGKKLHTGRWY